MFCVVMLYYAARHSSISECVAKCVGFGAKSIVDDDIWTRLADAVVLFAKRCLYFMGFFATHLVTSITV